VTARTAVRTGACAVAAYVVVAVATTWWSPGGMRPLFDGFGSHPGEYLWVDPPERFAEGNRPPEPAQATLRLAADGSAPGTATPPDGQALAQLQSKAVAPHPPDESARLDVVSVAAGTLGALPGALEPQGNAYRITLTYQPSGTPVDRLGVPGTVGLTSAAPATTLLYSADGQVWERKESSPLARGNGLTGALEAPGYYLAAGPEPADDDSGGVPLVVYVLAAAVPLGLAWLLLAGRNRASTGAGGGRRSASGPARRPPAGRPRAKRPPANRSSARKRPKRPPPRRR
jgi:hypothetical protein